MYRVISTSGKGSTISTGTIRNKTDAEKIKKLIAKKYKDCKVKIVKHE